MTLAPGFHALWPTPLAVHRHGGAEALNALLVRVFGALRVTQSHARGAAPGAFFASDDDLLQRVQLPEWQGFVRFIVERLRDTTSQANAGLWPPGAGLQVQIEGMWFQSSNRGAFHDVHTHGNCSWSGVYCVQVDAEAQRSAHPVYGAANGATRFYGPARVQAVHCRWGHEASPGQNAGPIPPTPAQIGRASCRERVCLAV